MPAELAGRVLARVGERTITLADYVAALERMDRFERLRYQTADRRKALLEEMINLELLAREAEQRGLDRQPETQALIDELLRDEALRRLRRRVPGWQEVSADEVRAYYAEHAREFVEPERRRGALIGLDDKSRAEAALNEARATDAGGWARLVARFAPTASSAELDPSESRLALAVPGDVGFVSAPSAGATDNEKVPEAVRAALFAITQPEGVFPELVSEAGRYYVVRLAGKSEARQRGLAEVEATVRTRIVEEKLRAAEAELLGRLRAEIPVSVNSAELEGVPEPDAGARDVP
jgi:peptidyl-prolyl cis-trans isomerase C